ncbi:MAG TPA: PIN domain-containing protein [Acidimicrobiales bacterium]|nr:PIN domain-containing protein [Acidimicrobiales bacterium]
MPAGARRVLAADTSLAVPLVLRNHEAHVTATEWRAGRELSLCGHAWIETYAVLTRLPGAARVSPADATRLLASNFSAPLAPRPATWRRAPELFAASGVVGGAAYDAWVALTALDHHALLASRDARAEITYRRLGADVVMVR